MNFDLDRLFLVGKFFISFNAAWEIISNFREALMTHCSSPFCSLDSSETDAGYLLVFNGLMARY